MYGCIVMNIDGGYHTVYLSILCGISNKHSQSGQQNITTTIHFMLYWKAHSICITTQLLYNISTHY